MGDILGLGLSYFGGFTFPDEDMVPTYCELLENQLMNPSKCVAVIPPKDLALI